MASYLYVSMTVNLCLLSGGENRRTMEVILAHVLKYDCISVIINEKDLDKYTPLQLALIDWSTQLLSLQQAHQPEESDKLSVLVSPLGQYHRHLCTALIHSGADPNVDSLFSMEPTL